MLKNNWGSALVPMTTWQSATLLQANPGDKSGQPSTMVQAIESPRTHPQRHKLYQATFAKTQRHRECLKNLNHDR